MEVPLLAKSLVNDRRVLSIVAVSLLAASPASSPAQSAQASPLVGKWHTERKDGMVEIFHCGTALCGRVIDGAPLRANPDQRDVHNPNASLRTRKVKGLRVLDGFSGGPKRWKGGPLYDPETGNLASKGTLTLSDTNTLAVQGCIAVFLCRTQTWRRAR